jgi:hypothetical protein
VFQKGVFIVDILDIVSLLTAFGLGSVISVFVQSYLARKSENDERSFRERQAAYIGLLEAYHRAAVDNNDKAAENFALWKMRCDLVAPKAVRSAIEQIVETNDDREARVKAHDKLKAALRTDLGIAK